VRIKHRKIIVAGIIIVLTLAFLSVITRLPDNSQRTVSMVIPDSENTSLGKAFNATLQEYPGLSGVHLLGNGRDAFVSRAVLARLAERSIDVQYYMFHQDTVGRLLINELLDAADRGVRVRLLVDDRCLKRCFIDHFLGPNADIHAFQSGMFLAISSQNSCTSLLSASKISSPSFF